MTPLVKRQTIEKLQHQHYSFCFLVASGVAACKAYRLATARRGPPKKGQMQGHNLVDVKTAAKDAQHWMHNQLIINEIALMRKNMGERADHAHLAIATALQDLVTSVPSDVVERDEDGNLRLRDGADVDDLKAAKISFTWSDKIGDYVARSIQFDPTIQLQAVDRLAKILGLYEDRVSIAMRRDDEAEMDPQQAIEALEKFRERTDKLAAIPAVSKTVQ